MKIFVKSYTNQKGVVPIRKLSFVAASFGILLLLSGCSSSSSSSSTPAQYISWGTGGSEEGQLANSAGFCLTNENHILVTDTDNHRIQKFDTNGNFLKAWGEHGSAPGQFNYPAAIAVDASGCIYVADSLNNRVQKFDEDGGYITEWGIN